MKPIARLVCWLLLLLCTTAFSQEGLTDGIAGKAHPRLLLAKGEEAQVQSAIGKNPDLERVHGLLLEASDRICAAAPLEHKKTGKRLLSVSREAIRRIFFLSYAWRMTGNKKYRDAAEQQLLTISSFADWNPTHYLDVAEMTMAAAIGYDWLYNELSPDSRKKIKDAILEKGIRTSFDTKYNYWLKVENNWNQVCNAGLAYGAFAVFESDPQLCGAVISRAVESIRIPMKQYAPDGAYPEGYGYWSYGTTYNVFFLDALEQLTGGDQGLSALPGFLKTADYFQHMIAPSGLPFNYADSGPGAESNGAMLWFAKKLKRPSLAWNELQFLHSDKNRRALEGDRFLPTLLLWGKQLAEAGVTPPEKTFWEGRGASPVVMMRTGWTNPDALFMGFKAGSPFVNHAHMDEGSFVFEAEGVRWAMDFGMQNYESLESKGLNIWQRTQNSQRWTVFRYTNYAHNTLTFDDSLQRMEGVTAITQYGDRPEFSFAQSDLSPVYKGQVKRAVRGVALKDKAYGLIQDEIETGDHPVHMQWRMLTSATVEITSSNEVLLKKNGKTLRMQILADQPVTLKTWSTAPVNDYDAPNPGTVLVGFEAQLPAASSKRFVVRLVPENNASKVDAKTVPLRDWK
ncbi:heparinase II/III domain-containing protein [Niabella drilacis]|uniref:Heparinase II/III-like protein n=1 Tax=Niabella drilacis (strain DSM 25811 / CCM 8410 / CCUG 62505 / LMG 26954 / E90) TaxID=1285928 RepID=A0A1G6WU76_NIADE|nr:heparinase II/III family protein [Niabella drilacis]SDD69381.1 Heparinase II/III-like protein [Niabella drilacis]